MDVRMSKKTFLVRFLVCFGFVATAFLVTSVYGTANQAPQAQSSGATEGAPDAAGGGSEQYSPISREYHLKAAFLRYVAKFVEWPPESMTAGTINLCVLGLVPSFEALNSINGKVVNDKTIAISKISEVNEAKGKCQILFITKTEEEKVKTIVNALESLPILLFGDMEHFAEQGGDMNFYILNNRLAIMINPPSVEKAHLKISDRMLKVVTVIPPVDQTAKPGT